MNDNDKAITETLTWIGETADQSKEFIIEQAPLYAQELIAWKFWSGCIEFLSFGLAVLICAAIIRSCIKRARARELDEFLAGMLILLFGLFTVFSSMASLFGLCGAVKAKIAPRVVIVEHIQGTLNNN